MQERLCIAKISETIEASFKSGVWRRDVAHSLQERQDPVVDQQDNEDKK